MPRAAIVSRRLHTIAEQRKYILRTKTSPPQARGEEEREEERDVTLFSPQ